MRLVVLVALLVLPGACGAPAAVSGAAQAAALLTAAERVALVYVTRPPCPALPVCVDRAIARRIGIADQLAYAAVKAAEAGTGSPGAALAAVAALSAVIPAQ